MSEDNNQENQGLGIPVQAVIAYLTDVYRHLDTLSFNIRQNIQNMTGSISGEATEVVGDNDHGDN